MKTTLSSGLIATVAVICCTASAFEVEFNESSWSTNGVVAGGYETEKPVGWVTSSNFSESFLEPDRNTAPNDKPALKFNTYNEAKGRTGYLKMDSVCIPRSDIVCDNVDASVTIYVRPLQNKTVDTVQLIATTNDWVETILIGNPVPIRDAGYTSGWRTISVRDKLEGVSSIASGLALKVGLKIVAGGVSTTYVFLHGLTINFVACATPINPILVSSYAAVPDIEDSLLSPIIPGAERGRMAAQVEVSPEDKVEDLTVYGVLTRSNGKIAPVTNELEKVGDVYLEKTVDAEARAQFDAGETVSVSVFTKYKSNDSKVAPLGEIKDDGFAYEYSATANYDIAKKGSVWINEFGVDEVGGCYVELCGTTNREYLSGWQVKISGQDSSEETKVYALDLDSVFNFCTNMVNGVVGLETYRWAELDGVDLTDATIELKNSAGVVEFSAEGLTFPDHYQMSGKAIWHGATDDDWSYDWSGTATDGTFTFGASTENTTFGQVNIGQGFRVPVGTTLYYTTMIQGDGEISPLPYASITAEADGILNGPDGIKKFVGQTETDGTAAIQIVGYSDDASEVPVEISVSAFAWKSENVSTNVALYGESVWITNFVTAAIAYDDFSKLQDYWQSVSTIHNSLSKLMYWQSVDGVLQLDTTDGYIGSASLTTKSYMSLRGKKCLDVTFDFKNEQNYGVIGDCTNVKIVIIDSNDAKVETEAVANKSKKYKSQAWYSVRQFMEVPADFAENGQVWIRIYANKVVGETTAYTTMDNLRVAAVDAVKINSLTVPTPLTEGSFPREIASAATLDLTPLTGGLVSNYVDEVLVDVTTNYVKAVAADLMLTFNSGTADEKTFAVPFKFGDGSLTNDIPADVEHAMMTIDPADITAITGGFLPGDSITYYARVTFDPDDADEDGGRDYRYSTDNVTATSTSWYVKGAKGDVKGGYSHGTSGNFSVTGPALSLVGDMDITANGVTFNYHAWNASGANITNVGFTVTKDETEVKRENLATNDVTRINGEYSIEGLAANTTYKITITAQDASGADLEATSFYVTTLPQVIGTPKIVGVDTTSVKVSVEAAAADVVMPAGWTLSTATDGVWTFTKSGLTPNAEVTAMGIYATNAVGAVSESVDATPGYTLAAAATKAPVVEKLANKVEVSAGDADASGNPAWTEYAVRITTSDGASVVVTNGTEEIWKPYSEWQNDEAFKFGRPLVDLASTNYFSFLTRNGAGVITTNEVLTAANSTNVCWDMVAAIVDNGAKQQADPFGYVNIDVEFLDYAQSENARAEVQYKVKKGEGSYGEWQTLTNDYLVSFPGEQFTVTNTIAWNAWEATGIDTTEGAYRFVLRAKVTDKAAKTTRASVWSAKTAEEAEEFTLDFTKPTVTDLDSTTPSFFNSDYSPMKASVEFSEPVVGFDVSKITVNGGTARNLSDNGDGKYSFLIDPTADGTITVQIGAGVVTDAFGNQNVASEVISRIYDNTAPTNLKWTKTEPEAEART